MQIVSLVSTALLTVIASIVGVQLIVLLKDLRVTVSKLNDTLDTADTTLQKISQPAVGLFAIIEGLKQSGKIVEVVSQLIGKKRSHPVEVDSYESE